MSLDAAASTVMGLSLGQDVQHTRRAGERFGVTVTQVGDGRLRVDGPLRHEPDGVLDHDNAGTGIRLMSGVCAGIDGLSVLTGISTCCGGRWTVSRCRCARWARWWTAANAGAWLLW